MTAAARGAMPSAIMRFWDMVPLHIKNGAAGKAAPYIGLSVHDPIGVIAEFKGNEFCQGGRDRLVLVAARSAVACQNVEIIFRNADTPGELPFGQFLLLNNLI